MSKSDSGSNRSRSHGRPALVVSAGTAAERFCNAIEPSDTIDAHAGLLHRDNPEFQQLVRTCETNAMDESRLIEVLDEFFSQAPETNMGAVTLLPIDYDCCEATMSGYGEPAIVRWLRIRDVPVVHLVRTNALDCLIEEIAAIKEAMTQPQLEKFVHASAIERINQLNQQQCRMRNWLRTANQQEIGYQRAFETNGTINKLAIHQVAKLTGLPSGAFGTRSAAEPNLEPLASQVRNAIRPSLMRGGHSNLIRTPKAA